MGQSSSRISPSHQKSTIIQNYKPSFIAKLFFPRRALVNAIFSSSSDSQTWAKTSKKIAITVQKDHSKLVVSLKRNVTLAGWEFQPSSNAQLIPPTILILQDWASSPGRDISIGMINALTSAGLRVVIFDIFASQHYKNSNNALSFLMHALGSIDYEFNPEYLIVHALTSTLLTHAMSHGILSSTRITFISPVDDFHEYTRHLCKQIGLNFSEKIIDSILRRFGSSSLPKAAGKVLNGIVGLNAMVVYSSYSSKEHSDASCLIAKAEGLCKQIKVYQVEPLEMTESMIVIEKILQFIRQTQKVAISQNSLEASMRSSTLSKSQNSPLSNGHRSTESLSVSKFNESWTRAVLPKPVIEEASESEVWYHAEEIIPTWQRVQEIEVASISLDSLINELAEEGD